MNFSGAFAAILKIRRILAIISILTGAGYKVAPMVYHKVNVASVAKAAASPGQPVITTSTTTNAAGNKVSACELGAVSLTNHYETCVSLGGGRDCLFTPNLIDKNNVQLTVAVESKNAKGKSVKK